MAEHSHGMQVCQVCTEPRPAKHSVPGSVVRPNLEELIIIRNPDWSPAGFICVPCLNDVRNEYIRSQIEKERGEISAIEQDVLQSMQAGESVVEDMNREFDAHQTVGERLADRVAEFGGSWKFIILFGMFIAIWVFGNAVLLMAKPFDPYPFILLNLALSMVGSLQAPIIMMSQNRAGERDRLRAENDFKVNLKSEIEVRAINEKLDQLLHNQWARLLEIQEMQMDLLEELAGRRK